MSRSRSKGWVTVAAIAAAAVFGMSASGAHAHAAVGCGHELWDLKTLSDPRRNLIYLEPVRTTVPEINARRPPRRTPTLRSRGFERHIWRVTAQITEFKLEPDSDIHMILFGDGAYMTAEIPSPPCLSRRTRLRRAIVNARQLFEQRCGTAANLWQSLGAVVEIDGVGFWDFPHGQRGHAQNYAELHPIVRIRFIAGCE